jgi:hypothetical protein
MNKVFYNLYYFFWKLSEGNTLPNFNGEVVMYGFEFIGLFRLLDIIYFEPKFAFFLSMIFVLILNYYYMYYKGIKKSVEMNNKK